MLAVAASAVVALSAVAAAACSPPPPPVAPGQDPLSLGRGDVLGNGGISGASISSDGRWAAFSSAADNLVPGDTNMVSDAFLRDRVTGSVDRVREHSARAPRLSSDGRHVSYVAAGVVGVRDRVTGTVTEWPTTVSNPVVPVVAADGSAAIYGAFSSFGIFSPACRVRELASGVERDCPAGGPGYGTVAYEAVSANGRFVLYYWNDQDGGGTSARLLWDRSSDTTTVVTTPVMVFGGYPAVSDDGRFVASVELQAGQPFGTVLHDLHLGTVTPLPVSVVDGNTVPADISSDGRHVLMVSEATNLVAADTNDAPDVFIWNVDAGTVTRISEAVGGVQLPNGALSCGPPPGQILADGSAGCIRTSDPVVAADTNGVEDAYLLP
jgi:TolB protein